MRRGAGPDENMGGSMVYVIMFMTMFVILSTGFLHMSQYGQESAVRGRAYLEARTTAKTIHQSFSQAVSDGSSEVMNRIWEQFETDCMEILQNPDGQSGADIIKELEMLEYELKGHGGKRDMSVDIVLRAAPARGTASVGTKVSINGYEFCMNADILFDDADGEILEFVVPAGEDEAKPREEEPEALQFHTRGRGVYRYYGEEKSRPVYQ